MSACQCRGQGFDPWSGKIPHTVELLSPCVTTEPVLESLRTELPSPCAATTEACEPRALLLNERGHHDETPVRCGEEQALLTTTRESLHVATKPGQPKINKCIIFYPWVRKIPWRREWNPLQYSCLGNPMDRGVRCTMVQK